MRLLCAAALVLPAFGAQAAVVFTTLHSFQVSPNGENPSATLVQGSDGNFYGTTGGGGTNGYGTVFQISTTGALITLHSFTGGNDGAEPNGLVQGSDGYFYGTTSGGGTNGYGTVFQISTTGALTTLYAFGTVTDAAGDPLDGWGPAAALVQGSDGNFYGSTSSTIFQMTPAGVLTTLVSDFGSSSGLVQGSDGYFYGTTPGRSGFLFNVPGTVFKISTNGALTTLYIFPVPWGSVFPVSGLVQGRDGCFYGTTSRGGTNNSGTVFQISTNGALTTLYSFGSVQDTNGTPLDGANPSAALLPGSDGYFYGTTEYGGTNNSGTVFQISTNGALTTLYSFTGNDGANPSAALVQGRDGYFYGTTFGGGTNGGVGTVFKISTNGVLTSLYSFTLVNDGANPYAGLVQGSDGNFYGTTQSGGTNGLGTVFQISTNGTLTSLYSFTLVNDGAQPNGLVQGSDGYFYGTTSRGGTNGYGTVFQISTTGELITLHSFTGGNDGESPSGLVQGSDGNLYGTTSGAVYDYYKVQGSVFQISTNGALTTLYSFNGTNDGESPTGLVQGSDGNLYGMTSSGYGTVFKISTNGALTTLYSFTGGNDGAPPTGLVQGSDGYFYGTTSYRGTNGQGTVFKISTNGALITLHSFPAGDNDGENPSAALVQGSDGNFYGTTGYGGTYSFGSYLFGDGTVFRIRTNGALTTLYSFTGGSYDSWVGPSGLVQGSDGSFYGTTIYGGVGGAGTVFRLTVVPDPQLTMIPSGPYVILTWPTNYSGFTLQSTTNLGSSAVWTTNSPPPVVIGGQNAVINTTTTSKQQFYRLSSP